MQLLISGSKHLGLDLTDDQVRLFAIYLDELVAWNRKFNLTAITEPEAIQTRHFLDSLTCFLAFPGVAEDGAPLSGLPSLDGLSLLDVGAGAGFPGLPLKIVRPGIKLTLLESVAKKAGFLQHVVARLGLQDCETVTMRAEDAARQPEHREKYDVVVARAVAELASLAEYCLPFVKAGGRFVAPKKGALDEEVQKAATAVSVLGGQMARVQRVEIPGLLDPRFLVVVDKVGPTPNIYPRRAGMPAKRPL